MKPTPRTSKHFKAGARAIANHLANAGRPIMFFTLTAVADQAAREAGRKTDLFESLWSYAALLPSGWSGGWLGNGHGDSIYHAIPTGWTKGPVEPSLAATLMGNREVHLVASPDA